MLFTSREIMPSRENCERCSRAVAGRVPPRKCTTVLGVAGYNFCRDSRDFL